MIAFCRLVVRYVWLIDGPGLESLAIASCRINASYSEKSGFFSFLVFCGLVALDFYFLEASLGSAGFSFSRVYGDKLYDNFS